MSESPATTPLTRFWPHASGGRFQAQAVLVGTGIDPPGAAGDIAERLADPFPHVLEIGLDLIWSHFNTGNKGFGTVTAQSAQPTGVYKLDDQDKYMAVLRVQKNILP